MDYEAQAELTLGEKYGDYEDLPEPEVVSAETGAQEIAKAVLMHATPDEAEALLSQMLAARGLVTMPATECERLRDLEQHLFDTAQPQAIADEGNTTPRGLLMVAPITGRLGTGDV